MTPSRRSFITGLAAVIAAPAVVRATSLMPVRGIIMDSSPEAMYDLLWQRYAECVRVMQENMVHSLYGGRLTWVENSNELHFTEILPEQVYAHLEISMPIGAAGNFGAPGANSL